MILANDSLCQWNGSQCSLKPPPTTFAFTVTVAIVTTLISFPVDVSFLLALTLLCSRRPKFEMIGLNSFKVLGTEVVDPAEYEDNTLSLSNDTLLFDPRKHTEALDREENAISYVLRVIRRHFIFQDNVVVDKFLKDVGIYERDKKLNLTTFQRLFFSTPRDCIAYYLMNSRQQAYELVSDLDKFGPAEEDLQESYLMQSFVIEQFSIIPKAALKRHFFQYARSIPKPIHPVFWLLGWIYVIGGMLYMLYFVLLWGSNNDGISLSAWGTNFALETLHACFITSTLRLLIFNVMAIELLRNRLVGIYQNTQSMANDICSDTEVMQSEREGSRLIQLFSPSCIAARWAKIQNLFLCRVLRSLMDEDVAMMREQYRDQRLEGELIAADENDEGPTDIIVHRKSFHDSESSKRLPTTLDGGTFYAL